MHAEIVMIGTELLLGEILDTNANKLACGLREIGLDLLYKTTVGDNLARITQVLSLALDRSDVVITSGGLGPTVDDMTRQAVANATGRQLVYSLELEAQIAERFRNFGRKMADNNKQQAYIPEGAIPLPNPVGTAPCFLSEDVTGRGFIISLPGVPRELEYMLQNTVLPLLIERMGGRQVLLARVLRTCAVGESDVDRAIADLETGANPSVGLAAHPGQTDVRLTAKAATLVEAEALIAPLEAAIRQRLGVAVYGVDRETVPEVVGRLLAEEQVRLGVVDTLTGGQLAQSLREAGFGEVVSADIHSGTVTEALTALGLSDQPAEVIQNESLADEVAQAEALASAVAPAGGLGLALVGPFADGSTWLAMVDATGIRLSHAGRNYQNNEYIHQWLVIQGLDKVRRILLDQLESPVD